MGGKLLSMCPRLGCSRSESIQADYVVLACLNPLKNSFYRKSVFKHLLNAERIIFTCKAKRRWLLLFVSNNENTRENSLFDFGYKRVSRCQRAIRINEG